MTERLAREVSVSILFAVACLTAFGLALAQTSHAQGTVATVPLQRRGLRENQSYSDNTVRRTEIRTQAPAGRERTQRGIQTPG
jgi:hypothetical protein